MTEKKNSVLKNKEETLGLEQNHKAKRSLMRKISSKLSDVDSL